MDAISPDVHIIHTREVPCRERLLLGLPGLGQLGDRRRRQALGRAEELPQRRPEILRRQTVQVQQCQHLLYLRGLAHPRRQDRRGKPHPLTGFGVNPLVVDPRGVHLDRARGRGHLTRLVIAIAHHQPMSVLVALISELGAIGGHLRPQRRGQHLLGTLAHDLIDHRRNRARQHDRRSRTITIAGLRDYIEHGSYLPEPARQRRSLIRHLDFRSSSGRCAQSRRLAEAHPQVLIIARPRSWHPTMLRANIFESGPHSPTAACAPKTGDPKHPMVVWNRITDTPSDCGGNCRPGSGTAVDKLSFHRR